VVPFVLSTPGSLDREGDSLHRLVLPPLPKSRKGGGNGVYVHVDVDT
jgi:hypothetical protein